MKTHAACCAIAVMLLSLVRANMVSAQLASTCVENSPERRGVRRNANAGRQAPERRDARSAWRYSDAGGGHRIDASLRLVGHRLRRGATCHNADGGRNGAKARRMQVASPDSSRVTGKPEIDRQIGNDKRAC